MPVWFNNKPQGPVLMTRKELYNATRDGKTIFPEEEEDEEEETTSLTLYNGKTKLPSPEEFALMPFATDKRHRHKSRKYETIAAPKRFEVPPPSAFYTYMDAPAAFILPPPIPEPIIAQPTAPAPAPEVADIVDRPLHRRADGLLEPPSSSVRVEPPTSHGGRRGSHSSRRSTSTAESPHGRGEEHGRRSRTSTPATSPAPSRGKKETRMIEDASRGPKPWEQELRLREKVVYRNADGSKTKQYYYQ